MWNASSPMRISPVESARRRPGSRPALAAVRAAAAFLAAFAIAAPAGAASSSPLGPPIPLLPPAAGTAPAAGADITAKPLAPLDPSWIGTLPTSDGAFPGTMWQGTPRATVAAALPQLAPSESPALRDLARRLLFSDAVAPEGADPAGGPSLATLRLERMLALGFVSAALPLADHLPAAAQTSDAFERSRVELLFAANDTAGACTAIKAAIVRYDEPWWDRALIACQALNGQKREADFGLSLLAERKAPRDPLFDALIETLDGHRRKLDRLPQPTPVTLALWAATKTPLPAAAGAAAGPAALHGYATNSAVPAALRLAAAERALRLGALPPDALAKLYADVSATPREEKAALAPGVLPATARQRAVLYDIAASAATPAKTRLAALAALLAEARKERALPAVAPLLAPLIAALPATGTSPGTAADAASALLAAGDAEAAGPWLAAADDDGLRLIAHIAAPESEPVDVAALLRSALRTLSRA